MMRAGLAAIAISVALASLAACSREPRGKDYLSAHPDELAQILKACANGTHDIPQECSNAADLDILRKARGSLGK